MDDDLNDTFLYFGFGSNLLADRIHANNPSAIRVDTGKIENYRLDFGFWSQRWNGAVATIVPDDGREVWGAVWKIAMEDISHLDRQEGVAFGIYRAVNMDVETLNRKRLTCRCYMLCNVPNKIPANEPIPNERKPSLAYLNVILRGAVESNLPESYIAELRQIEHNGWNDVLIQKVMMVENSLDIPETTSKDSCD